MKIAIINRSDSTGGAAIVTYRLMQALRSVGADARMLVLEKLTDDPHVISYANPLLDKYNFLAERWNIFLHNGFSRANLFKVDTAGYGRDITCHKWVREADVIMLNWINQGAVSLYAIKKLCNMGKPIIWTMHDMWPFTGVCHHALQCTEYQHVCHGCQFLDSIKADLSTAIQAQKSKIYTLYPGAIRFVAVSNWLAERCRQSRLLHNVPITVIPNALDVPKFVCERQKNGNLGIACDKKVIAMGAARLDDTIKGFDLLIAATHHLHLTNPALAEKLHLVLFGNIRDRSLLDRLSISYTFLGKVKGVEALVDIYTQSDIVLSTSRFETFGATLAEGMACGCIPVSFGKGGQSDIIDHLRTGYLASEVEPEAIAEGIVWAVGTHIDRKMLHDEIASRFSAETVAKQYIELCEHLSK